MKHFTKRSTAKSSPKLSQIKQGVVGMFSETKRTLGGGEGASRRCSFCGSYACISLISSLSDCQIVMPFRTYLHIHNILPHAKRRDDPFILREAEPQRGRIFLSALKCSGITSWLCLMRIRPILTTPSTALCASGVSWQHLVAPLVRHICIFNLYV